MATIAITLAGLGIVFTNALDIMRPIWGPGPTPVNTPDSHIPVAIVMIVFGSATIFGIVFLLIKLFMKLMHLPEDAPRAERRGSPVAPEYRPNQIQAPPPTFSSVTEHTTRNFDPIRTGEPRRQD